MKKKDHKMLAQDKQKLQRRLAPKAWTDQPEPMFQAVNLHYEISEKSRAIGFGGVGAIHTLVTRLGLDQAINENLSLLKVHVLLRIRPRAQYRLQRPHRRHLPGGY